ncbi:sulfate transporter CysZ [Thalassolituus sp. LLYu03]|uniref:sulfate transporter CysZ n=1 Tax=Thalassolituus sp. LLYu03 TaxID=3421656 RepID=UPI003D2B76C2
MNGNPLLGWQYLARGFGQLTRPGLKRYVALPLLMNIVIMSAATWWGGRKISGWIEQLTQWLPDWLSWLYWLLLPLALLTLLFVMAYFFSAVLVSLASPFNGLLSEHVERASGRTVPEESLWSMVRRTFGRELTKLGYLLPRYLLILVLSFIPVVNLAAPFLWFWFGSWVVALQYIDYSYDNHGRPFHEVRASVKADLLTALGFGALVAGLMMIPVVNWFVMPAAVIGATLLRCERLPLASGAQGKGAEAVYAEISIDAKRLRHGGSQRSDRG